MNDGMDGRDVMIKDGVIGETGIIVERVWQ